MCSIGIIYALYINKVYKIVFNLGHMYDCVYKGQSCQM